MGDITFTVLNYTGATVTFRAQEVVTGVLVMQSVPTNALGTAMIGQAVMATSLPVAIASNQTPVPMTGAGGTSTVTLAGGTATLAGGTALVTLAGGTALVTLAGGTANITQIGGAAITLGQAVMATSLPVAIASNQSPIAVTGSFSLTPTVASLLTVVSTAGSPAGVAIKATSGTLCGVSLYNNNSTAPVFLKIFNVTAGAVNSSVAPKFTIGVPPGGWRDVDFSSGASFTTAMAYWITKLVPDADTTAVAIDDLHGVITFI